MIRLRDGITFTQVVGNRKEGFIDGDSFYHIDRGLRLREIEAIVGNLSAFGFGIVD